MQGVIGENRGPRHDDGGWAPRPGAEPDLEMSAPDTGSREEEAVVAALRSTRLSQGPFLAEFERRLTTFLKVGHAAGVASGTAGLHLALRAAGVKRGDRVLTTPFSFVATANAILYLGARPIFVDVELGTGNIDPDRLEEAVEIERKRSPGRVKAVVPVHVFGQPAAMDRIVEIAREDGISIIEDACEALGSEYRGRKAGSLGHAAVFGFYPNKQITTGEGGAVVTDNPEWAAKVQSWRNQGRGDAGQAVSHDELGYNYRLDELSSALGCVQLERIEELLSKRERVAAWYGERLSNLEGVVTPRPGPETTRMSWFVYSLRVEEPLSRNAVQSELSRRGIPSRVYFQPIHLQPYYRRRFGGRMGRFPVAEALGASSLALPFSSVMTEKQVDRVAEAVHAAIKRRPEL